jgi:hypothetical protein
MCPFHISIDAYHLSYYNSDGLATSVRTGFDMKEECG